MPVIHNWYHLTFHVAKFPIQASDILVFGFVAHMFSPEDAHNFLAHLLMTQDFLRHYRMSYSQGHELDAAIGLQRRHNSRYSCTATRWTPADETDVRRYVEVPRFSSPSISSRGMGRLGFGCPIYFKGATTIYTMGIEKHHSGAGRQLIYVSIYWKRQIPTRDGTHTRNPITRARFMKHVATSVDKFFDGRRQWRIGIHDITQRHVKIIGAVHVSTGSWMPIVQLTEHVFQGHTNWHTHGGSRNAT
ncbi:hypothetical protein BGY98DRAFT_939218 [Russula aff. rugulosa BPL654]|nr:hypothetical protein BGY98DRAFT_939218 [Russula aff. rugulosa BPL654]